MRSRAFWPKSTKTPTRSATRQVVVATLWSPMRRSTSSASAFAKRRTSGKRQLGLDRREDVQPGRAGGLRIRREAELVHHLAHDERDLAHVRPLAVGARVEVDQQVVRQLDLGHARVPRVQLDAAEVRDPRERGRVVDDREHGRVAARERDRHLVDVVGVVRRHALLVEEVALDAVREPLHVERPPPQVRQRARRRRRGSSATRSPFVRPARREEELVRVRDRDVVAADLASRVALAARMRKAALAALARARSRSSRRRRLAAALDASAARDAALHVPQAAPADLVERRHAHGRHRQPGLPAVVRRRRRRRARRGRSTTRRPARASSRPSPTRSRSSSASPTAQVNWAYVPFNRSFAPGQEAVRLRHQPDLVHAGAREGRRLQLLVLRRQPGDRRAQGHADRERAARSPGLKPYKLGAQLGTTSYDYINEHDQAVEVSRPSSRRTPRRSRR